MERPCTAAAYHVCNGASRTVPCAYIQGLCGGIALPSPQGAGGYRRRLRLLEPDDLREPVRRLPPPDERRLGGEYS